MHAFPLHIRRSQRLKEETDKKMNMTSNAKKEAAMPVQPEASETVPVPSAPISVGGNRARQTDLKVRMKHVNIPMDGDLYKLVIQ